MSEHLISGTCQFAAKVLTWIRVIFACLTLLFLAIRRHRNGEDHMWHGPVTSCAWFNTYDNTKQGHRAKASSSSILPFATASKPEAPSPAKAKTTPDPIPHRSHSSRREYASEKRSRSHAPPPPPSKKPTRHDSGRSGKSSSNTVPKSLMSEIDNGLMLHPNDLKRPRQ